MIGNADSHIGLTPDVLARLVWFQTPRAVRRAWGFLLSDFVSRQAHSPRRDPFTASRRGDGRRTFLTCLDGAPCQGICWSAAIVSGADMSTACWRGKVRSAGPDENPLRFLAPSASRARIGAVRKAGFGTLSVRSHHPLITLNAFSPCRETSPCRALLAQAKTGRSS
jgi:hypothetical protein